MSKYCDCLHYYLAVVVLGALDKSDCLHYYLVEVVLSALDKRDCLCNCTGGDCFGWDE